MSAYATLHEMNEPLRGSIFALTRDEVMTAREVADLLKMPVSTIYELARSGELPARRLGRTWRFLRPQQTSCFEANADWPSGRRCGTRDPRF